MRILLYLIMILPTGCGIFGPGETRVLGNIQVEFPEDGPGRPLIEVPDTVSVATPFTISITTGVGDCIRGGETDVNVTGNSAIITPYDYARTGGGICLLYLQYYEHIALVTFDARGAATVVIHSNVDYEYAVWVE